MKSISTLIISFFILTTLSFGQNNSFDFDGTDDFVNVPSATSLISGSSGFSMSCWVYPTNASSAWPNFDGFIGFRNESNADFYLVQLNSTTVEARFRNSTGTAFSLSQNGLTLNAWQHYVLTYDGSNLKIYQNGVLGASITASGTITNSTVDFLIGKIKYSSNNFNLNGKIDEVGFWNKGLSALEISCMYQKGINPMDSTLQLYYDFDHGVASGTNTGIVTLIDRQGNINGVVSGASLSGSSSNWVSGKNTHTQIASTVCRGDSLIFGTQTLKKSGIYYQFHSKSGACDSIVALTLSIDTVTGSYTDTRTECSPYVWIDGSTYTTNNNTAKYIISGGASSGCDSVITLNLTINSIDNTTTTTGITISANLSGVSYTWLDCGNGNSIISGETSQSYTPTANGSYAVIVDNGSCSDTSNCVTIASTELKEFEIININLFPNPALNEISIVLKNKLNKNSNVSILNVVGKEIININNYTSGTLINIEILTNGIYFIKVNQNNKIYTKRFVKQ